MAASFLLLFVAGAGGPAPDLAAQLFYELRILLLHLLSKLLASGEKTVTLTIDCGCDPGDVPIGRHSSQAGTEPAEKLLRSYFAITPL